MPSNNEYKRYFIILQEDDKGYELASGKIPTGYAKIEIKNGRGKMTAYAQNVKNGDKADYRMLLIAPNKKAAVDMGRIMVDAAGRGELNIEFDADNVMKTGMNISDFMVAAVSSNTGIPLSGYTGRDKIQWKGAYNIINKNYDRMDKKTQPMQEVVTPVQMAPIPQGAPLQPITEMPQMPQMTQQAPMAEMPQMPSMPNLNLGHIVEGAKNVIGNVVEGATDVVEDVVGDVVQGAKGVIGNVVESAKDVAENVVSDVVHGAKTLVGGAAQHIMDTAPEETMQAPITQQAPMAQMPPMTQQAPISQMQMPPMQQPPTPMQPAKGTKKGGKETVQEVSPAAISPTPIQPKPAYVPAAPKKQQPVTEIPIQTQVTAKPVQPVEIPIQTKVTGTPVQPVSIPIQTQVTAAPVQPVEIPIVVKPIIEQPPIQPAPPQPVYQTETEIKAKFVIEEELAPVHHEHYQPCKVECIDYKDLYFEEECESDSDSDDREREKHHEHEHEREHEHEHEHEHDECPEHENAMVRRLMKVLGRLRKYEPFDKEEDGEAWFKVQDDIYILNNAAIPFMGSMMPLGYPYMMNDCVMMIGRKDYIIGVKYDRDKDKKNPKYIMFGMPGMHDRQEEAYYKMRGFVRFRPHKSRRYGYWTMTVDLDTGRIITK